ncbi:hypothetical protein DPMN_056678 [Dreissena polymorpha]|uniref:Uncharacterized protein n=1 Tax=Dreissena polymorpha TaxID=45954 RepID=A0A9D4CUU4_DREPO|nr:hypothetical protein DPMN_056678 [Dreissena polymorpha]
MDAGCVETFRNRPNRVVGLLESCTYQSLHDLRHELECIASAAARLLSNSTAASVEYDVLTRFVGFVEQSLDYLENTAISEGEADNRLCTVQTTSGHGLVGRPAYVISYEQLNFLAEQGFTAAQMGEITGTSTV